MTSTADPYDLLAATSSTGRAVRPAELRPVRAVHVLRWCPDAVYSDGWLGEPPQPGNAVEFDVGDTDALTRKGYQRACQLAGLCPEVHVRGSGLAVGSLQRVLAAFRHQHGGGLR
ncbi:hypothetical protein [Haloechinothrix salitolerans]|uniref:Uncharacterized protein n=1 Tax=Haloechinothrix salitolerans TaxID=926830 RepID=A0ABW2C5I9_9PSEU